MTMTDEQAKDLSVYGVAIEKDGKRIDPEHFYDTRTDEQVLCEAMGLCWHEWKKDGFFHMSSDDEDCGYSWTCKKCGEFSKYSGNPPPRPTFTQPAELWNLLGYMMRREDAEQFDDACFWQYMKQNKILPFHKWLITATYTDKGKEKLLFVKLCADWRREHPEKGE